MAGLIQEIPESVKATVAAINKELRMKPRNGGGFLKFSAKRFKVGR
jgi:hypothetical protein